MRCRPSWRTTGCASVWRPVRAAFGIGCRRGRTPWTRWPPRSRGSTPMDDSLADWLALREPFDAAARSEALTRALAAALPRDRPLKAVDLGAGRGSNVRYLASRLPQQPQEWLLVDEDARLLACVDGLTSSFE